MAITYFPFYPLTTLFCYLNLCCVINILAYICKNSRPRLRPCNVLFGGLLLGSLFSSILL